MYRKHLTTTAVISLGLVLFFSSSAFATDPSTLTKSKSVAPLTVPAALAKVTDVGPSGTTRVLIRAALKDGYPNSAQTKDGIIRITAHAQGEKGALVYFEVTDPDDTSPYPESVDSTVVDTDPNDNRDPEKSGKKPYLDFQNACLPQRTVQLGSSASKNLGGGNWEVWTDLVITNRCSGDNYVVDATGDVPDQNHYFSDQSERVTHFKSSGMMVAWKRIYIEMHKSYRKGATVLQQFRPDDDVLPDVIQVDNTSDFQVDDPATMEINEGSSVILFYKGDPQVQSRVISKTDNTLTIADVPTGIIHNSDGSTSSQAFPVYSGIRIEGEDSVNEISGPWERYMDQAFEDAPDPETLDAPKDSLGGGAFVEHRSISTDAWILPHYTLLPDFDVTFDFINRWSKVAAPNAFSVFALATYSETLIGGAADVRGNSCAVFLGGRSEPSVANTVSHEIGHQMGVDNAHVDSFDISLAALNWVHSDGCIMWYPNNRLDGKTEFDLDCLYDIRDGSDPK